jgi:hypothetical protein
VIDALRRCSIVAIAPASTSSSQTAAPEGADHQQRKEEAAPDEQCGEKAKINGGDGFVAALDQSGGSTPKALKGYGVEEGAWRSEEEMFGLIHQMRSRIITAPVFNGDKVIGAILFERTMDGDIDGSRCRRC